MEKLHQEAFHEPTIYGSKILEVYQECNALVLTAVNHDSGFVTGQAGRVRGALRTSQSDGSSRAAPGIPAMVPCQEGKSAHQNVQTRDQGHPQHKTGSERPGRELPQVTRAAERINRQEKIVPAAFRAPSAGNRWPLRHKSKVKKTRGGVLGWQSSGLQPLRAPATLDTTGSPRAPVL
jgi:hypothetical protein